MLFRNLGSDDTQDAMWQQLSNGVPTVAGLATLCSRHLAGLVDPPEKLSAEAETLLACASGRGMFEIRVSKEAFDSMDRLAAVCVEQSEESRLLFKRKSDPRQTLKFMEGFRQLCQAGLVMHHTQKEFSLTVAGFDAAEQLNRDDYAELIQFAEESEF